MNSKTVLTLAAALLAAPTLLAQAQTDTAFGAGASFNKDSKEASVAKDTKIPGTGVRAGVRLGARDTGESAAHVSAYAIIGGLDIQHSGHVTVLKASDSGAAGTQAGTTGAIGDAIGASTAMALKEGTKGTVYVYWNVGSRGSTPTVSAVVNVDGKDVATFGGTPGRKEIPVTVGKTGLTIKVSTSGKTSQSGSGASSYLAGCRVFFKPVTTSTTECKFASFGDKCGLGLSGAGRTVTRFGRTFHQVTLSIEGIGDQEFGLVAVGAKLEKGVALPASKCVLLVNPVSILTVRRSHSVEFGSRTDFGLDLQAVAIKLSSAGLTVEASNGLNAQCGKTE